MTDGRDMLSPKEVAERVGLGYHVVLNAIRCGALVTHELVPGELRIDVEDVADFCEEHGFRPRIPLTIQWPPVPAPQPTSRTSSGQAYDGWATPERDYAWILLRDPCCYCSASMEAIDHIDPLARGGEHAWGNFTAACTRCNSGKGARKLLTFLAGRRVA